MVNAQAGKKIRPLPLDVLTMTLAAYRALANSAIPSAISTNWGLGLNLGATTDRSFASLNENQPVRLLKQTLAVRHKRLAGFVSLALLRKRGCHGDRHRLLD